MPNQKQIKHLLSKLAVFEEQLSAHLLEAGSVKTDIKWLKFFTKVSMGLQTATFVALLAGVVSLIVKH